jgi:hypothetical protein
VKWTFLLLYLTCKALLLFAFLKLSRAIVPSPAGASVCALLLAVTPLGFGGLEVFHVNESFLTPRLPACGLALLGITCAFGGRRLISAALIFASALLHPLMAAAAGVLWIILLRNGVARLGFWGQVLPSILLWLPALLLPSESLDEVWRSSVWRAAPYNFPSEWGALDWGLGGGSALLVLAAGWWSYHLSRRVTEVLTVATAVAIGGMLGTVLALAFSHAFLFQAQPYRSVWLLAVLQIPALMWIVQRVATAQLIFGTHATFLLWFVAEGPWLPLEFPITLAAYLSTTLVAFVLGREFKRRLMLLAPMVSIAIGVLITRMAVLVALASRLEDFERSAFLARIGIFLGLLGPLVWFAASVAVAVVARRHHSSRPGVVPWTIVLVVCVELLLAVAPLRSTTQGLPLSDREDLAFVSQYLENHEPGRSRSFYLNWGPVTHTWVELGGTSYFHLNQVVGIMFNRETAAEAMRRAAIVQTFERSRYVGPRNPVSGVTRLMVDRLFRPSTSAPSRIDLLRLCAEPELELVVLKQDFVGQPHATNGRVEIHDCRRLRGNGAQRGTAAEGDR